MKTETRGGARPGAGRKPKPDRVKTVAICLTPAEIEQLNTDIQASGLTRAEYIRQKLFTPAGAK